MESPSSSFAGARNFVSSGPSARVLPSGTSGAAVPNVREDVGSRSPASRIAALDFTKGALVLIMVFYHWLNYFFRLDGSVYKYLRFLTPSFIFITGLLISHVYLSQSNVTRASRRLWLRGVKLLGIVLALNLMMNVLHLSQLKATFRGGSSSFLLPLLAGTGPVAFSILAPIGYLLILSAGLLIVSRYYLPVFHLVAAILVLGALVCEAKGITGGYLQLLSAGALGASIGYIPMDRINAWTKSAWLLSGAYLVYLYALTVWDAVYALQIVGVVLSLAVLYWMGNQKRVDIVTRLGRYSLFAYIVQILILQALRQAFRGFDAGPALLGMLLAAGILLTIVSVEAVDRARARFSTFNRIYGAVFS